MNIEELSGDASIRKGTKELMVPIVGEEREAVTKDVYDADERKIRLETEKAHKNKIWNDEIKNEDLIIHNGCMKLKGGILKKIDTREYFFWDAKKVYIVRADTGEVVGMRPIKDEETIQDFTEPEMQIKPDDIPEEFKQRLISFVPPSGPEIEDNGPPIDADYVVIEDRPNEHICSDCIHVDEQPKCREWLKGDDIKFAGDDPTAAVIKCFNFEKIDGERKPESSSEETKALDNQADSKKKNRAHSKKSKKRNN